MGKVVKIPYSKTELEVTIPEKNLLDVIQPDNIEPEGSAEELIKQALYNPISIERIRDVVSPRDKIAIITTDFTRSCPDDIIVPLIVKELNEGGVKDEDISIVIGTGMHRPRTDEEIKENLGEDIFDRIRIVNHDARDESNLINLGKTSSGAPIIVNNEVFESYEIISTGVIEPHLYAGYSGGSKGLAVGVAGEEFIEYTHSPRYFDDPGTRLGVIDDNPFQKALQEVAQTVGLTFIINVIRNQAGQVVKAVAGSMYEAFREGVDFADRVCKVKVSRKADIVIGGVGYPKDSNLYQASRAATYLTASQETIVKKGGMIIIPAQCEEGVGKGLGEQRFYEMMREATPDKIINRVRSGRCRPGQHRAYMVARTMRYAEVMFVGTKIPDQVQEMKLLHAKDMEEALEIAFSRKGVKATVHVVPNAISTLPILLT